MGTIRAIMFDFNGTLSHDEPLLLAIYQRLFARHGKPLTEEQYYAHLAGLSEELRVNDKFHRRRLAHLFRKTLAQDVPKMRFQPFLDKEIRNAQEDAVALQAQRPHIPEPEGESLLADALFYLFEDR